MIAWSLDTIVCDLYAGEGTAAHQQDRTSYSKEDNGSSAAAACSKQGQKGGPK